jgi:RNA-binding protein PNO1
MPAPTALLKPRDETPPDLPGPEQDEELLLDAPEAVSSDQNDIQAPAGEPEDVDMIVDEEGRPSFVPSKDVVCPPLPHLRGSPPLVH